MDTTTRVSIITDIDEIMRQDQADKEFLQDLLNELMEAY